MKRKSLPGFIKNPFLVEVFQTRLARIFTNWVFQGMLIMNPVEIVYKLLLDVLITIGLIYAIFADVTVFSVGLSFLMAHTINWIINGQPVALLMHIDIGKNNAEYFISYIEGLEKRIQKRRYLAACAAYGSLSIGNYKPRSDIDIRVIMKHGLWDKVRAANFCLIERIRAFVFFFPLDLYAYTLDEVKVRMSPKEPPIVFLDPDGMLKQTYSDLVSFEDFDKQFREVVLPKHQ